MKMLKHIFLCLFFLACFSSVKAAEKYKKPNSQCVYFANITGGYNYNMNFDDIKNNTFTPVDGYYGERFLLKNVNYQNLSMANYVSPRVKLYFQIEHLTLEKQQQLYFSDDITENQNFDVTTREMNFYAGINVEINKVWSVFSSVSLLNYNIEEYEGDSTLFYSYNDKYSDKFIGLALNAKTQHIDWFLSGNYLGGKEVKRYQTGADVTLYPLQQKNLYFTASFFAINLNESDFSTEWNNLYRFKLGRKVGKSWLEINYSKGDHKYFADANGLVIYNTGENIKQMAGLNFSLPLFNRHWWFSFYYRYIDYEGKTIYYDEDYIVSSSYDKYTYNNQSFTGGLSWYF